MGYRPHGKWMKVMGLVSILIGATALTGCRDHSPEARIDKISGKIASKFDFSEEQKTLLNDITADIKKDFAEERALRQSRRGEMENLFKAEVLDKARVKELIKERQARMDSKIDRYLDKVAVLHRTLTPEQKKEMLEKFEKFHRHHE